MEKLRKEVSLNENQYGGISGSGCNHFLIDCWQKILESLDNQETAVSLLSIDFSKAFNRVCHHACIGALVENGASSDSIAMVHAFLLERTMVFKVNESFSSPRQVRGGSPQGTKLGNFLFVVTINYIEGSMDMTPPEIASPAALPQDEDEQDCYGLRNLAGRISAIRRFNSGVGPASTPYKKACTDGVLRYIDESGRENSTFDQATDHLETPDTWREMPPWILKYVDDVNAGERHFLKNAVSTFSQLTEHKDIRAEECERAFRKIKSNSESYGMCVNQKKTQL